MSTSVHNKRKFFDFFPTPKFLEMPSVGIDISDQAIRYVEIVHSEIGHQRFRLKAFGEKKVADDVISSGFIDKPEEIKKLLVEIRKEHGFKFVNVSLPEEKGYLFKTELPNIEEKYFAENIEMRLEENVPIDASKSVFDYNLMQTHDDCGNRDAVVTVVPSKIVEMYSSIFQDAALAPISYELVTQAVARAVIPQDETGTCLIIHISEIKTGFGIVNNGALQFTSTVNVGQAVTPEDIEKKKKIIKDEILKIKAYWQTRNEGKDFSISRIILSGKESATPGFKEYLSEATSYKVDLANVWVNAFDFDDQIPEIPFEDSLDYAPAVGLAISRFYHA